MELQPHLAQLRRKAMGAEGKDNVLVSWEVEWPDDLEFYRIPSYPMKRQPVGT